MAVAGWAAKITCSHSALRLINLFCEGPDNTFVALWDRGHLAPLPSKCQGRYNPFVNEWGVCVPIKLYL